MATEQDRKITTRTLFDMKTQGEKIACLTAYDASFARQLERAGVEVILIGDSLGMVLQGHDSTLATTVDEMVYHGACVGRAGRTALRVIDMPFMSYSSISRAMDSAARLMSEGAAHMVKLEGGEVVLEVVDALVSRGIPVCAHLGLTPQSVNQLGGYRIQGREKTSAERIIRAAVELEKAGASLLVLECVPGLLASEVTSLLEIPVIGIGAGAACDGQVLVLYDMLGITPGKRPRFSKNFLDSAGDIPAALAAYVKAVKDGSFPSEQQSYT